MRRDLNEPLRDTGKGTTGGVRRGRLRNAIVVLEVAMSLALLVGAGLLMRSFTALRDVKLGFDPDHVLVARLPLPPERYKTARDLSGFFRPLLQRIAALPGFGAQKAQIFVALLGKQLGVRPDGWREAAGVFGEAGSYLSVADISDADSLARVRFHKKEMKAAAKAKSG